MKTASVFAALGAIVVAATSVGLSAQAQDDPQKAPASTTSTIATPALAVTSASTPAAASAVSAPAASPAAAAPASGGEAADPPLTKEQEDTIVAVILDKCTVCHGPENITSQHLGRAEWNDVLINMGASDSMTKDQVAMAARYLAANYGPQGKP